MIRRQGVARAHCASAAGHSGGNAGEMASQGRSGAVRREPDSQTYRSSRRSASEYDEDDAYQYDSDPGSDVTGSDLGIDARGFAEGSPPRDDRARDLEPEKATDSKPPTAKEAFEASRKKEEAPAEELRGWALLKK